METIRLQKYLSDCGVLSRRAAEAEIQKGTVTVNGTPVTVTGCKTFADIDCELMEVYEGTASRNGTTTLVNGAFPELDPGENAVSFTGWSRVEITPRWWSI